MPDLTPFEALALSLHHTPGTQALLLGSGLSRAAGIPTGWEITLDLVRRLAAVQGITDENDLSAWYRAKFGKEPSYSELLDELATTPSERRALLQGYIEAKAEEDLRKPTKAHHAIAKLVADGTVKVLLTTNFDRLLENALRDAGVEPTVIPGDDALAGATPLTHSRCTVVKVHGDYLDARIKNTDAELAAYSPAMNGLLDEIFDRYGLIVVGWSGEWDLALRSAVLRAPSRRYPLYWVARGEPSELGRDIIAHRQGRIIPITDADSFFTRLQATLDALRAADRPHPQSMSLTLALGRRYCRDDQFAFEWSNLLADEVAKVRELVADPEWMSHKLDSSKINELIQMLVVRSEGLRRLCAIGSRWGTSDALRAIRRAIVASAFNSNGGSGLTWLLSLRDLAASLAYHWAVLGLVYREDYAALGALLLTPIRRPNSVSNLASTLPMAALDSLDWKVLEGLERHHTPASDFMHALFFKECRDIVLDTGEVDDLFDKSEAIIALEFAYHRRLRSDDDGWFWAPIGRWVWKNRGDKSPLAALGDLKKDDPMLAAGLFGGSEESLRDISAALAGLISQLGLRMY